jgi:CBS domain-containing protein
MNQYIHQIMTADVVTVTTDQSLMELREILDTRSFHHLVVLKNDKVVGIISVSDLSRAIHPVVSVEDGFALTDFTAEDIMTKDPITITSDTTLEQAADIILTNRLHALPVVDNNELVGIATSHDLLQACYS